MNDSYSCMGMNYKGISSVCFKRDINSGKLWLHEVNGRFPQGHATSQLCGVNLPYIAYQHATGQATEIRRVPAGSKKWISLGLDFDAFRDYRKGGELSTMDWLKSLGQVRKVAEFSLDDLKPFFRFLQNRIWRGWAKDEVKFQPDSQSTQLPEADRDSS